VTYFTGAFPSACGKTSTAMLPGETVLGDDIAYLRPVGDAINAVNVEAGIFGIIRDVNAKGDPLIWDVLHKPGEVIFGNVLVKDGKPYWLGMGEDIPDEGTNFVGEWTKGMTGPDGKEVPPAHKNARYTIRLEDLANLDPGFHEAEGVPVGGVIYGGRDSDTSVPVTESFDWAHGVITMGAALESESTAATIGAEGVRNFDLMSNLQFLAIPIGKYIQNHLDFGKKAPDAPKIFNTNYFLKGEDGNYLNGMLDKAVWVKWAELRVHGDVQAIETPCGMIPMYQDLKRLFAEVLDKEYTQEDYVQQFTLRTPELAAKMDRILKIYHSDVPDAPEVLFETLEAQKQRVLALQQAKGPYVSPLDL
jgi:phosphoenolpyruvate carboxykinase (GTP)